MSSHRNLRGLLVVCSLTALVACGTPPRPSGGNGPLAIGAPAPDVAGETADGQTVKLSDFRGRPAVVYFYPKDGTPGCTTQAEGYRDAFDRLSQAGIVVFGVSRDSAESHRAFRKAENLPFPMVSDESGEVSKAYGVPSKFVVMTARVTFLIDRDGNVAQVWPDVDPAVDLQNVLAAAAGLSSR